MPLISYQILTVIMVISLLFLIYINSIGSSLIFVVLMFLPVVIFYFMIPAVLTWFEYKSLLSYISSNPFMALAYLLFNEKLGYQAILLLEETFSQPYRVPYNLSQKLIDFIEKILREENKLDSSEMKMIFDEFLNLAKMYGYDGLFVISMLKKVPVEEEVDTIQITIKKVLSIFKGRFKVVFYPSAKSQ